MNESIKTNKKSNNGLLLRLVRSDEFNVLIPLIVIMMITVIFRPDFIQVSNLMSILGQLSFIAIVALAASFTLMTGNVDISTGRIAGLAGMIFATLIVYSNWHWVPAMLLALVVSAVIGLINGFMIVKVQLPDFVATMGMMYVAGGVRYLLIRPGNIQISVAEAPAGEGIVAFFDGRFLGLPIYCWIMLAIFAIAFFVIKKTMWGRRLLACGDNREVAALAGIPVSKMRISAYVICALLCGIAGLLITLDVGLGLPETGDGWEFRGIAGCAVGGVSLAGGKGSPLGVLIGITLVFITEAAIIFLGFPTTLRIAIRGIIMALAVLYDTMRQNKKINA